MWPPPILRLRRTGTDPLPRSYKSYWGRNKSKTIVFFCFYSSLFSIWQNLRQLPCKSLSRRRLFVAFTSTMSYLVWTSTWRTAQSTCKPCLATSTWPRGSCPRSAASFQSFSSAMGLDLLFANVSWHIYHWYSTPSSVNTVEKYIDADYIFRLNIIIWCVLL